jgi:hypothetical protein
MLCCSATPLFVSHQPQVQGRTPGSLRRVWFADTACNRLLKSSNRVHFISQPTTYVYEFIADKQQAFYDNALKLGNNITNLYAMRHVPKQ